MSFTSNLPSLPPQPPTVNEPISAFLTQLALLLVLAPPPGITLRVEVTLESTTGVVTWVLNASDSCQYWRHSAPKT